MLVRTLLNFSGVPAAGRLELVSRAWKPMETKKQNGNVCSDISSLTVKFSGATYIVDQVNSASSCSLGNGNYL